MLDDIDREILNIIQNNFPVSEGPYETVGNMVGLRGDEVLDRVRKMHGDGVIRKIGPFFDAAKMGHKSTLCAVQVPEEKIPLISKMLAGLSEVTHNYLREGEPNLWFTLIAKDEDRIKGILEEVSSRIGLGPIYNLPSKKMFKIKVDLRMGGND